MKKRILSVILAVILVIGVCTCFTGCSEMTYAGSEQDVINTVNAANTIQQNQPTPTDISYSLERYNLIRRAYWVNGQREKANSTTIVNGNGAEEAIQQRIQTLKTQIEQASTEFDKDKMKERLAKMTNGVAIIRVGANTETELSDKKLRLEDALSATRAAIDEGVVAGGGVALLNAATALTKDAEELTGYERTGFEIVLNAIQYPIKRIVENAGHNGDVVVNEIIKSRKSNYGFDVYKEEYVDMFDGGIIDPAKVTRTALQNALSISSLILTTEVLVANNNEQSD